MLGVDFFDALNMPDFSRLSETLSQLCLGIVLLCAYSLSEVKAQQESEIPLAMRIGDTQEGAPSRQSYLSLMSAKSAMDYGFFSIAEKIYQELLEKPDELDPDTIREIKEQLVAVLLNRGKLPQAKAVFGELSGDESDNYRFLHLLLLYQEGASVETLDAALLELQGTDLGPDQAWVDMVRGILLARKGNVAESRRELDQALNKTVNNFQRSWMEALVWREEILSGEVSETLAISLKTQLDNAVNPLVASQLVQQYAIVLKALNREQEAARTIEVQLSVLTDAQREQKDRLLMFLALLTGSESGKARYAIEDILLKGKSERIRSMAFYFWLSSVQLETGNDVQFLNGVLQARPDDVLKNEFSYVLALRSFYQGDFESCSRWIDQILHSNAEKKLQESCLRMLIAVCWSQKPPQYRLATEHLQRLKAMTESPVEQDRLSLLIADSYFLNGDYENALPNYRYLSGVETLPGERDEILYKLTSCYLRIGNIDGARPILDEFHENGGQTRELVWGSEWNFNLELVTQNRSEEAIQRLENLNSSLNPQPGEVWNYAAKMRLGWLIGFLHFQNQDYAQCVELCEATTELYQIFPPDQQTALSVVLDEVRLLYARALFAQGRENTALGMLQQLRDNGNAETAASSYMIEARYYWSRSDMVNAQRALVRLADQYPTSQYAPVALYEAAMNVESRGTESSDQEAIRLYERISSDFPNHPLNFMSKLRQGDLLRKSNQFASAIQFYESMLREYSGDERLYLVEMALGESYLALGSTRADYIDEATRILERIFDLSNLPVEVRIEAGTKAASGLIKVNRNYRAQELLWRVVLSVISEPESTYRLGASGRYWLARAALMLSEQLIDNGETAEVYRLLEMAERMHLPGVNLIRNRL